MHFLKACYGIDAKAKSYNSDLSNYIVCMAD